jgi:hypothetical protein
VSNISLFPLILTTIQTLPLHTQRIKTPCQALHRVANPFEHAHTTGPALNVLTQPTQRDKLGPTVRLRTPVYLVLVTRALQVLIEPLERLENRVAQETLVRLPVPRAFRRPRRLGRGRLEVAQWPGEQTIWVRDVVTLVRADDEAVEFLACHAGRAGPRFNVKQERTVRDEGAFAAAAWTAHSGRLVLLRGQVVAQVGRAVEDLLTVGAVVVLVAIVFLELRIAAE